MSSFEDQGGPPPRGPFVGKSEDKGGDLLWRQHPAPLDRAILWHPAEEATAAHSGREYLRFITVGALKEIATHVEGEPDQGKLGFLAGGSFSCPHSRVRYVVIDATLRDPLPIREDQTSEAVGSVWANLQEQLRAKDRKLLGWYHTHPAGGLELTAPDIITHSRFFRAPWQVAMLLEPGAERSRAVVCELGDEKPPNTVLLPFYELLEPAALAGGGRPDYVTWQNYRSVVSPEEPAEHTAGRPVAESTATGVGPEYPRAAASGSRPRVLLPDQRQYPFGWRWSRLRRWLSQRRGLRRLLQVAGVGAIILVVVALWKLTDREPAARTPPVPSQPATSANAPLRRIDQLAEDVGEALGIYEERAWLFDDRKMTCADLAEGLVPVVDLWYAYNAEGRAKVRTLDPERRQREDSLLAAVRNVELHFSASGCPTP